MNKVLIIVDMQNIFLKNMSSKNKKILIQNQLSVIKACVKKKIPVIELEYDVVGMTKAKTISKLHNLYKPIYTVVKKDNGGFTNTDLEDTLIKMKVREIILIGINANGCVQDTAMGGINRGYKITTVLDTIANVWRDDLKLSKSNHIWYQERTSLFESTTEFIKHL